MGIWGASQAIAAGFGGLLGTGLLDIIRSLEVTTETAFSSVFLIEALLFMIAAIISLRIRKKKIEETSFTTLKMVE